MTEPDLSVFAQYIPGFEFLQNLTRQAAGSTAPGTQSSVPGMPSLSHWVAPTFDVEELDKRIQDLRAVHFWLDQNTKALAATIQALEVQKMTLATLKSMNVSMQDMADAFKIRPESTQAPVAKAAAPAPAPSQATENPEDSEPASSPAVDPMQWWSALTQQFQTIATSAIQDMADHASRAAEQMAQGAQTPTEAPVPKPARKAATSTRAKAPTQVASRPVSVGGTPAKSKPRAAQSTRKKTTP